MPPAPLNLLVLYTIFTSDGLVLERLDKIRWLYIKLHNVTTGHKEKVTWNLKFRLGVISFYGAQGEGPVVQST